MSDVGDVVGTIGRLAGPVLTSFAPEPRSRNGIGFGGILRNLSGDSYGGGIGGSIDPVYSDLIAQQIQAQQQMQLVSFISNIEKSKHETQMAAIRNVRVG